MILEYNLEYRDFKIHIRIERPRDFMDTYKIYVIHFKVFHSIYTEQGPEYRNYILNTNESPAPNKVKQELVKRIKDIYALIDEYYEIHQIAESVIESEKV
jgi:hypothetical protein